MTARGGKAGAASVSQGRRIDWCMRCTWCMHQLHHVHQWVCELGVKLRAGYSETAVPFMSGWTSQRKKYSPLGGASNS